MSKTITIIAFAAALVSSASLAVAQDAKGHDHQAAASGTAASTQAFEEANAAMHKGMAIDYSGDADVDFARSMIAHHQGAIDMAKVELAHGKDAKLRKMAEDIIKAQEAEIADMQAWLAAHDKR